MKIESFNIKDNKNLWCGIQAKKRTSDTTRTWIYHLNKAKKDIIFAVFHNLETILCEQLAI